MEFFCFCSPLEVVQVLYELAACCSEIMETLEEDMFILILFLTSGRAMSEREHGKYDPPSWDGNPTSWRHYQDEVRIWTLGQDLDVKYCLAARLIRNLTGPARRAALTIAEADLLAIDSNKKIGIQNVMAKLKETFGDDSVVRKGESIEEFFGKVADSRYRRQAGERLVDWITRWDEGVHKLEEDGIKLLSVKEIAGWFFLKMSALSPQRTELVLTKTPQTSSTKSSI